MVTKKKDSPLLMNILALGSSFGKIDYALNYPDFDNRYWREKLIKELSILEGQYNWIIDNDSGLLEDDFLDVMKTGGSSVKQLRESVEGVDPGARETARAYFSNSISLLSKYIFTSG
jgi:hypothetical protein